MIDSTLDQLGWDDWFAEQALRCCDSNDSVARVAAVDRNLLLLKNAVGAFRGQMSGRYLHETESPSERPCVGDWVCVRKSQTDQIGLVQAVITRKNCLRRKVAGESIDYQMIAANIDTVFIVQSCHFDFNLKRLERYLVMVRDGGATPHILLTKTDLVKREVLSEQLAQINTAGIEAPVLALSNVTNEGIDALRQVLEPKKTYCFVGSSGVGKSTLVNSLVGSAVHETKAVSDSGEGRHTTVRRELIVLDSGAMVIDNPGMREFGLIGAEAGIEASFTDIYSLSSQCRFRDCTHISEPGCAVLAALKAGSINAEHYDNFIKLRSETTYHQATYAEKRAKDREFGRYIKSAKKDLKKD